MSLLRIAAIDFLNPAPLMWSFEHAPDAERLQEHYSISRMTPADCAAQLGGGAAELGLIPIAEYASLPGLAIVPGCAIASLAGIRSILLVLREQPGGGAPAEHRTSVAAEPDAPTPQVLSALQAVRSVALDTSSRTSAMYTRILFRKYWRPAVKAGVLCEPRFEPHAPVLDSMLAAADAALLIGDPALFALQDRAAREARTGERLHYLDMGLAWRQQTGVPWVSAFWAARVAGLGRSMGRAPGAIVSDLKGSRDAGLAHIPDLTREWSVRLGLPPATVHTYLNSNIHYHLDAACLAGVERFYADALECGLIARGPALTFL